MIDCIQLERLFKFSVEFLVISNSLNDKWQITTAIYELTYDIYNIFLFVVISNTTNGKKISRPQFVQHILIHLMEFHWENFLSFRSSWWFDGLDLRVLLDIFNIERFLLELDISSFSDVTTQILGLAPPGNSNLML